MRGTLFCGWRAGFACIDDAGAIANHRRAAFACRSGPLEGCASRRCAAPSGWPASGLKFLPQCTDMFAASPCGSGFSDDQRSRITPAPDAACRGWSPSYSAPGRHAASRC